jgi:hypothetical protein
MDKIIFEAGDFSLEMQATTYKNDPEFLNTNLWVAVACGSFAGAMTMDVGTMELEDFVRNMVLMNKDMKGSARIEEPYGNKCFIEFEMGKTGHVKVCGKLIEGMQKLSFESCFDQTYLSGFVKQLSNADAWQEVKI